MRETFGKSKRARVWVRGWVLARARLRCYVIVKGWVGGRVGGIVGGRVGSRVGDVG